MVNLRIFYYLGIFFDLKNLRIGDWVVNWRLFLHYGSWDVSCLLKFSSLEGIRIWFFFIFAQLKFYFWCKRIAKIFKTISVRCNDELSVGCLINAPLQLNVQPQQRMITHRPEIGLWLVVRVWQLTTPGQSMNMFHCWKMLCANFFKILVVLFGHCTFCIVFDRIKGRISIESVFDWVKKNR